MLVPVTMHKAEKFAIDMRRLSDDDRGFFMKNFGCARKVYNLYVDFLYRRLEAMDYDGGAEIPAISLPEVTEFKKMYPYLKEADSLGLANAKIAFERAVKRYNEECDHITYTKRALRRDKSGTEKLSFRGLKGMPKFHAKAQGDFSYTTNCQHPGSGSSLKQDTIRLEGTDLGDRATVYVSPTIDGRDVADVTFTYDVTFPVNPQAYMGTTVTVGGQAAATLGTAFQMQLADIGSKMQNWSSAGPAADHIMFYGVNANGKLANSGSTANGYGHWFNAAGNVDAWANGYVYSEFTPSALSFYIGQYPGKSKNGSQYTIRQALRYRTADGHFALATFVFNITVGPEASVTLAAIDYADPTGISEAVNPESENGKTYDLYGRQVQSASRKGLYIMNGRKTVVK